MKKIWFALLFLAGGISHEIRHPLSCHAITARQRMQPDRRPRAYEGLPQARGP